MRERFVRVCERRTLKVLKAMRLLRKCFDSPWYEFTDADVNKVRNAIGKEYARLESVFPQEPEKEFSLLAEPQRIALGKGD